MSRPRRSSVLVATIGALALALSLAACGRKGGLEPPPGGHMLDRGVVRTPSTASGAVPQGAPPVTYDEDGRPIPPPGQKKKFPADWLID